MLTVIAKAVEPSLWWFAAVAAVGFAAFLIIQGVWQIPRRQVRRLDEDTTAKDRFDAENEARRTLVQLLGGLGIVATIALTLYQTNETRMAADRNLEIATNAQIAQRLSQAIDQLDANVKGRKSLAPLIGGIATVALMAVDGQADPNVVADMLAAYVRSKAPANLNSRPVPTPSETGVFSTCAGNSLHYKRPADVQAALHGLSLLNDRYTISIDLSDTDLTGSDLRRMQLRSANLRDATLVDANLTGADLRHATVVETDFSGACLNGADLSDANAVEAEFSEAHVHGATFHRACLAGAYHLDEMSPQQLEGACATPVTPSAMARQCRAIGCTYGY